MSDLYNYKSSAVSDQTRAAARDRLFNVLYLALEGHMSCFGPIDSIATVPSSGGRNGVHPVDEMRRMFGEGFAQLDLAYVGPAGLERAERRVLDPQRFRVDAGQIRGKRVLLLDDAWVSGVHIQSAAGALKLAGAAAVVAVPIGRVISPGYTEAKAYLEDHRPPPPFSPDICPVSGQSHI
jgi:glutamine phosphoribosylpyrophosphate amidotransferase